MFTITVPSSTDKSVTYLIRKVGADVWTCSCPDSVNRSRGRQYSCRHISELTASLLKHGGLSVHSKASAEILSSVLPTDENDPKE